MIVNEPSPAAIAEQVGKMSMSTHATRREAVDRYMGVGLEDEVRKYFAPTALQQVSVDVQKVAQRFVHKRYSVYQEPPERTCASPEDYLKLQGNLDMAMPTVERLSGVINTVGLLVTVTEERVCHHIPLVEFEPIFLPDDPEPIGLAYPLFRGVPDTRPEDLTWVVWTDTSHFLVSGKGSISYASTVNAAGETMTNDQMLNPYGTVPVVFVHRDPRGSGGWMRPVARDLLSNQLTYNVLGVQGNIGAMFQALGQEVLIGVNDARDVVRGADKMLMLPPGADYRMEAPPGQLSQIEAWQRWKLDGLAATMGLKIKWADGTGGATSGEHQRILEVELTTSIMGDFPLWREFELERHRIARAVYAYHFATQFGEELSVNFTEPNIPQSAQEMRDEWAFEYGQGLASKLDYWRRKDPSATDEQLMEMLKGVSKERAAEAALARAQAVTPAPGQRPGLAALLASPPAEA